MKTKEIPKWRKIIWSIRSIIAVLSIVLTTLSFVSPIPHGLVRPVLPHHQLLPLLLGGSIIAAVIFFAVTFAFGRVYCSIICPLGIWQDAAHGIGVRLTKRRFQHYHKELFWLRYAILAIFAIALAAGLTTVASALDPYSIFGRFAGDLLVPLKRSLTAPARVTATYSMVALYASLAFFLIITIVAAFWGRFYCNAICPIGTLLGTVSRFAWYKPTIDEETCVRCHCCERYCPASCIDIDTLYIDTSRCIDCLSCTAHCPTGALSFKGCIDAGRDEAKKKTESPAISRKALLTGAAVAAGAAAVTVAKEPLGTVPVTLNGKKNVVLPPGAVSRIHFSQNCTSCHLCVSRCHGHVLKPALLEYGIGGIGQPYLDFTQGYCRYKCHVCSTVCPTGAIRPFTLEAKQHTKIGTATYYDFHCLITTSGATCGICAQKCPIHAITMVPGKDGKARPKVDTNACIGCGACEYHCPAKPKAISVTALSVQQEVE